MRPHQTMLEQIALARRTLDSTNPVTAADLEGCTTTVEVARRCRVGAQNAVYIAWGLRGECLYVGSVSRSTPGAAHARLREHLGNPARRATWYAVTIMPLEPDLALAQVRLCEGWVAWRLRPRDGSAHPAISPECPLASTLSTR